MTNNITLTKTGVGTVGLFTVKVEENYNKKLTVSKIGRSKQNRSLGPKTWIVDLLLIERSLTINGYITGYGGDTAQQQRTKLRAIMNAGGTFIVVYDGESIECNSGKLSIVEESADEDTVSQYDIVINVTAGIDR